MSCPRRIARALRRFLSGYLADDEAPLGFLVHPRRFSTRQYVLTDRCGFVLGATGTTEEALSMLGSHLTALLPLPTDHVRFRVRAAVTGTRCALAMYPLLYAGTLDGDMLSTSGFGVLDRLAVDVHVPTRTMRNVTWDPPRSAKSRSARGHVGASDSVCAIDCVFVPSTRGAATRTPASIAAELAGEALAGARSDILDAAVAIASSAAIQPVDLSAPVPPDVAA